MLELRPLLGFGQEQGFRLLFGAGEGLSLPVVSSSAASDGTPGIRGVPLRAALSHGRRNRKRGVWSGFSQDKGEAELFTLPSWTEILSLLLLASCSRDRVLALHAAENACCSGETRRRAGGGGCQGLAGPRSRSCCCSRAAEGATRPASLPLQRGLEQGEGHRVTLTCCNFCQ